MGFQFNPVEDTVESIGLEMVEQLALNTHQVGGGIRGRGAGRQQHQGHGCSVAVWDMRSLILHGKGAQGKRGADCVVCVYVVCEVSA